MFKRLLILSFMLLARALLAQEEMPLIVDPPQVSMTAFTNWQEIQLTYTVRWLDGYRPLFDLAKPENMSFSPFELDPIKGYKLELLNQRKYKNENYVDLTYHLRHIGEKKGDIVISEQAFTYVREEPGKTLENLETKEFKAAGVQLRYDSVLTKNADDIMDRIDFGSFKKQVNLLNYLMATLALMFAATICLLFRKPAVHKSRKNNKSATAPLLIGMETEEQEERLMPKETLERFQKFLNELSVCIKTEPNQVKTKDPIRNLYNQLRQLLFAYNPDLAKCDAPERIRVKIFSMKPDDRLRHLLRLLSLKLQTYYNLLFVQEEIEIQFLEKEVESLKYMLNEMRFSRIFRYNLLGRKQKISKWFMKLLWRTK